MLNSPNMILSFTGPLPVHCAGGRRPGSLADAPHDCSTSEDFLPTTVLTENLCRYVQQILSDRMPTMPFLTTSTITLNFLHGFSSSPGWLLVTRTRGAWWCHYRGHWRSGSRHLSPRSRVCAQEWHCKDIHSHIHSHTHMHTPKKREKEKEKRRTAKCSTHQTWCFHLLVLFLSTVVVGDGQVTWQMLRMTAPHRWPSCLRQYWQKTFVGVFNKYSKIACQQCHL